MPPLEPGERVLGDKAYQGAPEVLSPFKKKHYGQLNEYQKAYNAWHSWCRATVEHLFGFAKRYQIIGGMYRGRIAKASQRLQLACHIIFGVCFLHNRHSPHRNPMKLGSEPFVTVTYPVNPEKDSKGRRLEREDAGVDSGFSFAEFATKDKIEAWWRGVWHPGIVTSLQTRPDTHHHFSRFASLS